MTETIFWIFMALLLPSIWIICHVIRYFGWRGHDREFDTEYRFNMGHEGQGWIWQKPNWLIFLLKLID
jgi:hypothetical protein